MDMTSCAGYIMGSRAVALRMYALTDLQGNTTAQLVEALGLPRTKEPVSLHLTIFTTFSLVLNSLSRGHGCDPHQFDLAPPLWYWCSQCLHVVRWMAFTSPESCGLQGLELVRESTDDLPVDGGSLVLPSEHKPGPHYTLCIHLQQGYGWLTSTTTMQTILPLTSECDDSACHIARLGPTQFWLT